MSFNNYQFSYFKKIYKTEKKKSYLDKKKNLDFILSNFLCIIKVFD